MKLALNFRTLLIGAAMALFAAGVAAEHHKAKADIVDTAVSAGSFTTLVTAIKAAGL